jgi:hypothetical protein
MRCQHCGSASIRFLREMTNVCKYWCRHCRKVSYIPREPLCPDADDCHSSSSTSTPAFVAYEHQGKGRRFIDALRSYGYRHVNWGPHFRGVKFVLTDTDILGRRAKLERIKQSGVGAFFVFPHAARPDLVNDIYQEWAHISAHFVVSDGHAQVMRAFGYSRPLVPVGWSLCPIRPFRPRPDPYRVLFAPIHPRCSPVDQQVNQTAFGRLEKLARAGDIHLTVRFIQPLSGSGLERVEHPQIEYTVGNMDQGYRQIDEADVVVAHQTFAWLAVARGTPTVMMAEEMPTHVQLRRRPVQYVKNWKRYEHLLRYPLDLFDARDPLAMLREAAECDRSIADWRRRMIGSPFRPDRFVRKLEQFL